MKTYIYQVWATARIDKDEMQLGVRKYPVRKTQKSYTPMDADWDSGESTLTSRKPLDCTGKIERGGPDCQTLVTRRMFVDDESLVPDAHKKCAAMVIAVVEEMHNCSGRLLEIARRVKL